MPRQRFLPLILLVVVLAASAPAAARALSLDALRQNGYGAVPLRVVSPSGRSAAGGFGADFARYGGINILTVDAEINGRHIRLVLDTGYGGQGILLHNSKIQELGLSAEQVHAVGGTLIAAHGTKMGSFRGATADRVRLGRVELTGVPLFFTGAGSAFRGGGGQGEGDGYFGAPFLAACGAVIDLQNAVVYLHPPGRGAVTDLGPALRGAGMVEVPLSYGNGQGFVVGVQLNGAETRMVVDTGAGLTSVDPSAVKGLRAAAWNSRMVNTDAGGDKQKGQFVVLDELKIGGHPVHTRDVRFVKLGFSDSSNPPAGLLGADILGRNGAIINCGTRKLYLIPAGGR